MSQPNGDAIPLFRKILKLLELQRRGLADAQAPRALLDMYSAVLSHLSRPPDDEVLAIASRARDKTARKLN